ncbi:hypothetical protein PENSPDRAFT_749658 [Peniophora sp. CONT]|nr:hypothetical protein PENSPDRAFT_749658 [Peniophora sp. CONT]
MYIFLLLVLLATVYPGYTQTLSIPANWDGTSSPDTRDMREQYANAAAQALVNHIGIDGSLSDQTDGQALASMYSTLALQDLLSGNATWEGTVTQNVQTWATQNDLYGNGTDGSLRTNSNGLQWALAYYYTYKAYGQMSFLTSAQTIWDAVYPYFVTQEMVANPPQVQLPPTRNITWLNANGCFDKFASGGVFFLPEVSDDARARMETVGPFATLAGYLYEATQDDAYKVAGLQAMTFLGVLTNPTSGLQHGEFDLQQCLVHTDPGPGFQGWYILPLSIWANITGNSTLSQTLQNVVSRSAQTPNWVTDDGVLTDANPTDNLSDNGWDDKAILIRALSEVLRRYPGSSDLASFIQAFLTIQYNNYTRNGPFPQADSSDGNIVALDVLNAAFDILPADAPTAASANGSARHHVSVGRIVGGVIGGVAAAAAVALFACFISRKPRGQTNTLRKKSAPQSDNHTAPNAPATVSTSAPRSHGMQHVTPGSTDNNIEVQGSRPPPPMPQPGHTNVGIFDAPRRPPPQAQTAPIAASNDAQRPQPFPSLFSQTVPSQVRGRATTQPRTQVPSSIPLQPLGAYTAATTSPVGMFQHSTQGIWVPSIASSDSDSIRRRRRTESGSSSAAESVVADWEGRVRSDSSSSSRER